MARYNLLSVAEVAKQLQKGKWFVYQQIRDGKLAHYMIGKQARVSQEDLDLYVARARNAAKGDAPRRLEAHSK